MITIKIILCTTFGYIFLSSAFDKILNIQNHYLSITAYKILPTKLSYPFAVFDIVLEASIALSLIFGFYLKVSLLSAALLLGMYTVAVAINLFRGRTEIDCGCGGVVGTHKISIKLIMRNLSFISIIFILALKFNIHTFFYNFNSEFWMLQTLFIFLCLTFIMYLEAFSYTNQLKKLMR
ncbi:methylamine utilization protein MauE [Bacillus sp. V-88]|jgi:Methylamine utilisation protein MauE|uniref:Methylamine utilisation protein MauE domain-containing protein n=1 Tax=Rossellomorea vietnamensis TaxID=218284 RepID=A0A6I6USW7_9BACI|nr:MauE/DoxX family redox-associated membrane protein [Rossellomorea vietnamensis]OXS58166.1 hypothetical protein B1B00_14550 [Bacillus sp. DSM 27956]PRX75270.1 methylamine utilization protein MauE [Bacillus sp. V-88]QHE62641.1 hypothetical protein FHE72_17625 [Rossellomorea vietnamensis]SLK23721.1 Methylamine utilisation protein MauE [Bacillus sp. V-88]